MAPRKLRSSTRARTSRGVLLACLCVVIVSWIGVGRVGAQEYPSQSGTLLVGDDPQDGTESTPSEPELVEPGQEVRVSGGGFVPGSEVTITIESKPILLVLTTADVNGEIDVVVMVPIDVPVGDHTLKATGDAATGGRLVLARPAAVVESVADALGSVADTGSGSGGFTGIPRSAIIAVALICVLVISYVGWKSRRPPVRLLQQATEADPDAAVNDAGR